MSLDEVRFAKTNSFSLTESALDFYIKKFWSACTLHTMKKWKEKRLERVKAANVALWYLQ